jgi:spore germination protein KA
MIPTSLLLSIARAREGVPFPAFAEAMMMEIIFEFLREAGVRLPRQVGQAVSIVGALVIGQAAVTAGLVSPAMVIIVSLTAIASFAIPNYSAGVSLRLLRFPIMFMAAGLGLFGIMAALMAILIHLCSLRSFGIPYISPLSPFVFQDWKDFLIRMPVFTFSKRPKLIGYEEPNRQDYLQVPLPPQKRRRGGKKQ